MVKVQKVAAWKIGDRYIEDQKRAEQEVRRIIAEEMLDESMKLHKTKPMDNFQAATWIAENHDRLEAAVKKAMAGS